MCRSAHSSQSCRRTKQERISLKSDSQLLKTSMFKSRLTGWTRVERRRKEWSCIMKEVKCQGLRTINSNWMSRRWLLTARDQVHHPLQIEDLLMTEQQLWRRQTRNNLRLKWMKTNHRCSTTTWWNHQAKKLLILRQETIQLKGKKNWAIAKLLKRLLYFS